MAQKLILLLCGILLGLGFGYYIYFYTTLPSFVNTTIFQTTSKPIQPKRTVIGFLPYWLTDKASADYSRYITTLTYFGLAIDTDGTILRRTIPQQTEPGWNALKTGKLDPFFKNAREHNVSLSLLLFSGNTDTIETLMTDPIPHAHNLVQEILPITQQFGFSDINIDIEYTKTASGAARTHFTQFIHEIKQELQPYHIELTVDISPTDVIIANLIDAKAIGKIADRAVIMAYDYHYPDSYVTGPIAPLYGASIISEYDVSTAVSKAIENIPNQKIILGLPLYGYEWETIGSGPRSAIIPGTGILASNRRAEDVLKTCASCSAHMDQTADEPYIAYQSDDTYTYHQIFYPDKRSTLAKVRYANTMSLGGVALWALGYEGTTILDPLTKYKNN